MFDSTTGERSTSFMNGLLESVATEYCTRGERDQTRWHNRSVLSTIDRQNYGPLYRPFHLLSREARHEAIHCTRPRDWRGVARHYGTADRRMRSDGDR